jgi:hypothetical protein
MRHTRSANPYCEVVMKPWRRRLQSFETPTSGAKRLPSRSRTPSSRVGQIDEALLGCMLACVVDVLCLCPAAVHAMLFNQPAVSESLLHD